MKAAPAAAATAFISGVTIPLRASKLLSVRAGKAAVDVKTVMHRAAALFRCKYNTPAPGVNGPGSPGAPVEELFEFVDD